MSSLFIILLIILLIASVIIIMASMISKKSILDREKSSPFECGFDPFSSARIPFSLRFFMIAIIFLVFDVEIAILLPMPLLPTLLENSTWTLVSSIFILTLILGLIHEWNNGALDWTP